MTGRTLSLLGRCGLAWSELCVMTWVKAIGDPNTNSQGMRRNRGIPRRPPEP